jgi:hypothetical protein
MLLQRYPQKFSWWFEGFCLYLRPYLPFFSDPELQYQYYADYAVSNSYGINLISAENVEVVDSGI